MAKITAATVKSFIRKNMAALLINQTSHFDGMTDCVESCSGGFVKAQESDTCAEHTIGVQGAWFVLGGRDYFSAYEENGIKGYSVSNCCGSFTVGIAA